MIYNFFKYKDQLWFVQGKKVCRDTVRISMIVLLVAITVFTRAVTLTYNMEIHPDEHVFFENTDSLLTSILHPDVEFEENKEYPEGAYLFHLPFLLTGRIFQRLLGIPYLPRLWVRISSMSYFVLGILLGIRLLKCYFPNSEISAALYTLTMCFSLFFIEHSRYGVGDMISLFLLLLIITLTAESFSRKKTVFLFAACAACGAMGAVKWPSLFFALIPVAAWGYQEKKTVGKRFYRMLIALLITIVVTFLLFSPKAALDWHYFIRASRREMLTYVIEGKAYEDGGLLNHIAQIVVYTLIYSDFPLSLFFVAAAFLSSLRNFTLLLRKSEKNSQDMLAVLFYLVVPVSCILFFSYNLFIKMLVFRTYTPYFAIATLYAADYIAGWYKRGGVRRHFVIVLTLLMVFRGSYLIYVIHDDDRILEQIDFQITEAVDENWKRTFLVERYVLSVDMTQLKDPLVMYIDSMDDFEEGGIEIKPGDLVITGGYAHGLGGSYMFPVSGETAISRNDAWNAFKQANSLHWKGQIYPDYYYYLFGGWIRGGSLSTFTMPCNYIYYRS